MSEEPSWIGARPSAAQIFSLMFVGVTGLMIPGLQPLLLGGLVEQGRIAANQVGQVATAELFVMGITAGVAGSVLKSSRLRLIALLSLALLATIDFATTFARGDTLTLLRAAAGMPSGLLVWITIALIARTPTPERWAGAYVTAQTVGQFIMAAVLSAWVTPNFGPDGGFACLALLCVVTAIAALYLPSELSPLPQAATAGLPNARGWTALAVSFLLLAVTSGAWVYVEQLARQSHLDAGVAGLAISISLACQVAGGLTATILAGRVHWFRVLMICAAFDFAVFVGFATLPNAPLFIGLSAVLGFVWLLSNPFLVPLTIEADPTRRAALLIGGAQLVGGSLGPLFASFFVTDADARGALGFSIACLAAAAAIALFLHMTRSRTATA